MLVNISSDIKLINLLKLLVVYNFLFLFTFIKNENYMVLVSFQSPQSVGIYSSSQMSSHIIENICNSIISNDLQVLRLIALFVLHIGDAGPRQNGE